MSQARVTIGIIGCGNMGSALIENFVRSGFRPEDIFVFDKEDDRQKCLSRSFAVSPCISLEELVLKSEVIVIAVKPQDFDNVLGVASVASGKLYISIAAGITISCIQAILGSKAAIIRAMPNLNALIAKGVTALSMNSFVSEEQIALAEKMFKSVGEVVFVKESQMNAVTAISGSGPAFVAYLLDSLGSEALERIFLKEAVKLNIEVEVARVLARATVDGTKSLLLVNFDAPTLIKRVCSKGGTTEAGMKVLEEKGKTEEALTAAIHAAEKRAGELARKPDQERKN